MTDFNLSHQLLDQKHPAVPTARKPSVDALRGHVRRRRRRRRRLFWTSAAMVACLVGLVSREVATPSSFATAVPSEATQISVVTESSDSAPTTSNATNLPEEHSFRAFARVLKPVPLFEMDESTQTLQHLGWTSSEQLVPVDVSGFTDAQQSTMKAVLHQNPAPTQYSL